MDNTEKHAICNAVINKAINYIFDHIDEEITVDDVAHYCSYSRYHLTRMFKEETDEALYQFIKRIRLERSAWCLKVEKEKSITEIGEKYYDLCQTISPDQLVLKKNEHILLQNFQGGKYAAYHFKGFPQFLFMVYQEIFCRWLSRTGNQLDEKRPIFDIYRLVGEDGYMEIDICFPLK